MIFRLLKQLLMIVIALLLVISAIGATINSSETIKQETKDINTASVEVSGQPDIEKNSAAGEEINWQVISGGGSINVTSTNYKLSGTVGQTAVNYGTGTAYNLSHGFWQNFGGASFLCGDANGDDRVNLTDAIYLIHYIFKGGLAPDPLDAGDANCDGRVNLTDAVYLVHYVFKGGSAPCANCPQ